MNVVFRINRLDDRSLQILYRAKVSCTWMKWHWDHQLIQRNKHAVRPTTIQQIFLHQSSLDWMSKFTVDRRNRPFDGQWGEMFNKQIKEKIDRTIIGKGSVHLLRFDQWGNLSLLFNVKANWSNISHSNSSLSIINVLTHLFTLTNKSCLPKKISKRFVDFSTHSVILQSFEWEEKDSMPLFFCQSDTWKWWRCADEWVPMIWSRRDAAFLHTMTEKTNTSEIQWICVRPSHPMRDNTQCFSLHSDDKAMKRSRGIQPRRTTPSGENKGSKNSFHVLQSSLFEEKTNFSSSSCPTLWSLTTELKCCSPFQWSSSDKWWENHSNRISRRKWNNLQSILLQMESFFVIVVLHHV